VDYVQGYGKIECEPKTTSGKPTITLPQFAMEEIVKHRTDQAEARKKSGDRWEEHGLVFPTIQEPVGMSLQEARALRLALS
jgi:hypothetical protein